MCSVIRFRVGGGTRKAARRALARRTFGVLIKLRLPKAALQTIEAVAVLANLVRCWRSVFTAMAVFNAVYYQAHGIRAITPNVM